MTYTSVDPVVFVRLYGNMAVFDDKLSRTMMFVQLYVQHGVFASCCSGALLFDVLSIPPIRPRLLANCLPPVV